MAATTIAITQRGLKPGPPSALYVYAESNFRYVQALSPGTLCGCIAVCLPMWTGSLVWTGGPVNGYGDRDGR